MTLTRFPRAAIGIGSIALLSTACLDRPVVQSTPMTNAIHRERIRQTAVDKIDLLFMIDNSASMADKQLVLAEAIPDLLNRLVAPACVELVDGEEHYVDKLSDGSCPEGAQPEFDAVKDIHIGIISSSLGGISSHICNTTGIDGNPTNNDRAHLLSRNLDGSPIPTYADKGFLQWDPEGKKDPAGANDEAALGNAFKDMVVGVGQSGCGYEQSLEAVYRFLVDPEPYERIVITDGKPKMAQLEGIDEKLLQQRRDFLRPDSLVAIVSLSDENDCSMVAEGQGFNVIDYNSSFWRSTSACKENPNDVCCFSCGTVSPPEGCPAIADDPECQKSQRVLKEPEHDRNLRCFNQKKHYGFEFLHPVSRYVDAVQQRVVPNRQGEMVQNPLYSDLQCDGTNCKQERDESLVFWAMIIGVPWQDIANDPKDLSKGYMTMAELEENDRFSAILGDPTASPPVMPTNPLMIESIEPRAGQHPITGDPMVLPDSASPPGRYANPINGHERDVPKRNDLQYACVFDLVEPRENQGQAGDDCYESATSQNPLCQDPETGEFGTTQYAAKAYPGTRHLQVAQGLGDQAIVASICPANLKDSSAPDYGYRPAIGALIDRLKDSLRVRCLPRPLEPNVCAPKEDPAYGQVPCIILEAQQIPEGESCDCNVSGRGIPNPQVVTDDVTKAGNCVCEITQLTGDGLSECENETDPSKLSADGWCYVDPTQGLGNPELVAGCMPTERRLIRFVKGGNPTKDATVFIACQEAAFNPGATGDAGIDERCSEL